MRLRADQPKARNLVVCLLDGKAVPMCYEADEEEGWVKSWMPMLPDAPAVNGEEIVKDEAQRTEFQLVKRQGRVKLVFRQDEDEE